MNVSDAQIETVIHLDQFKPRHYQLPIFTAMKKGYKKIIAVLPRRAGKDMACFMLCVQECLKNTINVMYCLPAAVQARRVIFDAITNENKRLLSYIPPQVIASINSQELKIRFVNGSQLNLIGSDTYDRSLVGSNFQLIIFSEYALADPRAWHYARPVLAANQGTAIFISTPRGKNHFYSLFELAQESPDWFAYKMTSLETNHISPEELEKEKREMSEHLFLQEFMCDFSKGVEGAFYSRYMDEIERKGQIGDVPWEPSLPVNTAWDLGVRDPSVILFFQNAGQTIRIIDAIVKTGEGLEYYINEIKRKPYIYGYHVAPHDIKVRELGSGVSRWEKARQLGITFDLAPNLPIMDGIEAVRTTIPRCWFNKETTVDIVKALQSYRKEYNAKLETYDEKPLHNWASHAADAMRYLAVSYPKLKGDGMTADELNARYRRAMYGEDTHLPPIFRNY